MESNKSEKTTSQHESIVSHHNEITTHKLQRGFQNRVRNLFMGNIWEKECLNWKIERNKTCARGRSASFAFRSRVLSVMFYLDGLFVSWSNGVALDPPPVFSHRGERAASPPPGLRVKECGCKMRVWGGTAGEGSESVWSLEGLGVLSQTQIHTKTHITIHTFPPICRCCCFPTPTPSAKYVCHNANGNSCTRLPMNNTNSNTSKNR